MRAPGLGGKKGSERTPSFIDRHKESGEMNPRISDEGFRSVRRSWLDQRSDVQCKYSSMTITY